MDEGILLSTERVRSSIQALPAVWLRVVAFPIVCSALETGEMLRV